MLLDGLHVIFDVQHVALLVVACRLETAAIDNVNDIVATVVRGIFWFGGTGLTVAGGWVRAGVDLDGTFADELALYAVDDVVFFL